MNQKLDQGGIKDLIEKTLDLWHVPGLAVTVVQDGQVIMCEGFGLRNVAHALPVTPATLFPIASCTKAFTAMAVGMLVDSGLLEWDKPVKNYLPDFKMWDDFATERLTLRDCLTHRSGLPGHDMLWFGSNFNRREILERLRYLEPVCDLRISFHYQNLMFAVAGILVEEITGISWEQFVQTKIFNQLGMNRSNFSTEITQNSSDFATPYLYRQEQIKEIPFLKINGDKSGTSPAGGICSCINDMAMWVQFQLNKGKIGDDILVSEVNLDQMHSPQIYIDDPDARKRYGYEFTSYGLGWGMRSHKGEFLLEHDGMTDGFYSLVSMMPRHKIGIVALSNGDAYWDAPQANLVPNIISYSIYDQLLGLETTDWNALMKSAYMETAQAIKKYKEHTAHDTETPAPAIHPLESYLGDYEHPGYGLVSARMNGDQLQIVVNGTLFLPLRHSHSDIFEVYYELADQWQKITFLTNSQGYVDQIAWPMEPRVKDILFTRVEILPTRGTGSH